MTNKIKSFIWKYDDNALIKKLIILYSKLSGLKIVYKSGGAILNIWGGVLFRIFNKVTLDYYNSENIIYCNSIPRKCYFYFGYSHQSKVFIGKDVDISNVKFDIRAIHEEIVIDDNVKMIDGTIGIGDNNSKITIGKSTNFHERFKLNCLESTSIVIGQECNFSTDTHIQSSDSHSVIDDSSGNRVNNAKSVSIGNRVWFGEDVTCLKGVVIDDDTIVGNKTLLTSGHYNGHSVYIGTPARLLRSDCHWVGERVGEKVKEHEGDIKKI